MNTHQKNLLRHEGFVHGFIAARGPNNPRDRLRVLDEAERAWILHREHGKETADK